MTFSRVLRGRAWVFGDNLDADWDICDLNYLRELAEKGAIPGAKELGARCLVRLDPDFPGKVRPGDFIVAGANAGCSSACLDGLPIDPHLYAVAALALKGAGIGAVLCESAAANFQRNAIDAGLPVVECRGITGTVGQGDELRVDMERGTVVDLTTGVQMRFPPLPTFILQMLAAGGLYPYIEKEAVAGKLGES